MTRYSFVRGVLTIAAVLAVALAAAAAQQGAAQRATIGKVTMSANGGIDISPTEGVWTARGGVTVTTEGTTLTAEAVKIWVQKGGRSIQRVEATGSVHVTGTYAMAQAGSPPANWKVNATSQEATYDGGTQTAVMSGKVDLQATNTSTGEVVTAQAGKATYAGKTQQFKFDQEAGEPVQVQWQQPTTKAGGQ